MGGRGEVCISAPAPSVASVTLERRPLCCCLYPLSPLGFRLVQQEFPFLTDKIAQSHTTRKWWRLNQHLSYSGGSSPLPGLSVLCCSYRPVPLQHFLFPGAWTWGGCPATWDLRQLGLYGKVFIGETCIVEPLLLPAALLTCEGC